MIIPQDFIRVSISGFREKCHKSFLSISKLELDREDNVINLHPMKKRYLLENLKVRYFFYGKTIKL